jgi:hypothetical protein
LFRAKDLLFVEVELSDHKLVRGDPEGLSGVSNVVADEFECGILRWGVIRD